MNSTKQANKNSQYNLERQKHNNLKISLQTKTSTRMKNSIFII